MKKTILILLIHISIGVSQPNPEWVSGYQNTFSQSASLSMDLLGNIFISGMHLPDTSDVSMYLTLKFNSSGVFFWNRFYLGPDTFSTGSVNVAHSNIADGIGNVYVGGNSKDNLNDMDVYIIKYNTNGDTLWARRYNGPANAEDRFAAMVTDNASNLYVTFFSNGGQTTGYDYTTIKYDSSGNELWEARYNNSFNSTDAPTHIAVDSSHNVYVTGYCNAPHGFLEYVTVKYDESGVQQWAAKHSAVRDARAVAVAVDKQKNVYVTGQVDSLWPDIGKITTIKYDSAGNEIWERDFRSNIYWRDTPIRLLLDTGGYPVVLGSSLIKYNSQGDFLWADTLNWLSGRYSLIDGENNLYQSSSRSDSMGYNRWIETAKYNENGNILWSLIYGKRTGPEPSTSGIAIDAGYNIYISGNVQGPLNRDTIILMKYSTPIGITGTGSNIPRSFALYQNYPNPFNPRTKIKFDIAKIENSKMAQVKLIIYDILGRETQVLLNGEISPGKYEIEWDGSNFASGIYFYSLVSAYNILTKKMILVK